MGYEIRRPPVAGQGEKPTTRKPTPTRLDGARSIAVAGTKPTTAKPSLPKPGRSPAGPDEAGTDTQTRS